MHPNRQPLRVMATILTNPDGGRHREHVQWYGRRNLKSLVACTKLRAEAHKESGANWRRRDLAGDTPLTTRVTAEALPGDATLAEAAPEEHLRQNSFKTAPGIGTPLSIT